MNDLILRFIVAFETIATALTTIASGQQQLPLVSSDTPAAEKPKAPRGKAAAAADTGNGTSTADKAAADKAAADKAAADKAAADKAAADKAAADKAAADKAAADKAAADKAKDAEPEFDYEVLKKNIIALASAGNEGKEEALRILTDAGVAKGGKASDAPKAKWKGMSEDAVASLAKIKEGESFA